MSDLLLEIARSAVMAVICGYLLVIGRKFKLREQRGWRFLVAGFGLLLFGSILDITDNFEGLNHLVVVGDTRVEAFLEKVIGYLAGFVLLFVGFWCWVPLVGALRNAQQQLAEKNEWLESEITLRTAKLREVNQSLRREIETRNLKEIELEIQEDTVKRLNDQKEMILKSAGEGIYGLDLEGKTTFANPAASRMIGWEPEELIGKPQHDILHHTKADGSPYPRDKCPINAAFKDGEVHHVGGEVFWRKDGSSFPVEYVSTPIRENGKLAGAVVVFRDITSRIQAEAALNAAKDQSDKANRAKSEFLSSMSHELRTPLNSILGFAQLMRDDPRNPADDSQKEYLGYIIDGGEHLTKLIDQVLDLAMIEAGQCAVSMERVSPGEVIRECLVLIEGMAKKRGIQIIDRISGTDLPEIQADCIRFKQILLNLLSNGIKYNRDAGLLTLTCEVTPEASLRIGVTDTGLGIARERQGELFQPFNRLGAENSEVEGSGIGLALAKQLVELMGGRIGCDSEAGRGSTFWIELELAEPAASDGIGEANPVVHHRTIFPGDADPNIYTLLYVEDNPANLRLMQEIVGRVPNLSMLSAHNAELGLEMAEIRETDVIIMDINLPGMDGFDALKCLRRTPHTNNVPVIALSANAMPTDIDRGINAGFHRYLTKPIKIDQVLEAIQDALQETRGNDVKIFA
jgi:PAS domain S-box-containing protein